MYLSPTEEYEHVMVDVYICVKCGINPCLFVELQKWLKMDASSVFYLGSSDLFF